MLVSFLASAPHQAPTHPFPPAPQEIRRLIDCSPDVMAPCHGFQGDCADLQARHLSLLAAFPRRSKKKKLDPRSLLLSSPRR